jgi:hypothetical protein
MPNKEIKFVGNTKNMLFDIKQKVNTTEQLKIDSIINFIKKLLNQLEASCNNVKHHNKKEDYSTQPKRKRKSTRYLKSCHDTEFHI